MSDVGDFIGKQQIHEMQMAELFGWKYIENQTKGSSFDFLSPDGKKIEAKFDWDSIKTGNHYLEYGQTSTGNGGEIPSGFAISADETDFWVVVNEEYVRFYTTKSMKAFLKMNRSNFRTTRTRTGINHNRVEQYSLGLLIPFSTLDELCFLKFQSPFSRSDD